MAGKCHIGDVLCGRGHPPRLTEKGEIAMSVATLVPESVTEYTHRVRLRTVDSIKTKVDNGLVRYDAWFLVFIAVILALGATLLAGLAIWCVVKQHKTFTGRWSFKDFGLKVYFQ